MKHPAHAPCVGCFISTNDARSSCGIAALYRRQCKMIITAMKIITTVSVSANVICMRSRVHKSQINSMMCSNRPICLLKIIDNKRTLHAIYAHAQSDRNVGDVQVFFSE